MIPYMEQRRFRRIPVRMSATVFVDGTQSAIEGEIKNISLGGAFVETRQKLSLGSQVLIELNFQDGISLKGCVVTEAELDAKYPSVQKQASVIRWVDESNDGLGIEFSELAKEKKIFIEKLMNYYDLLSKAGVNF